MAEHYKQWNSCACAITIPQKYVQSSKSSDLKDLSAEIASLLDPATIKTVQATSKRRFVLEFSSAAAASTIMRQGIDFRAVQLTPTVAFHKLTSVFVKRAPFGVPDDEFVKALSTYGRVVSVKPLSLKKYPKIFSGTRMVRMAVSKPIPCFLRVMDFSTLVRYHGQPLQCFRCRRIGYSYKECPDKDIQSARRSGGKKTLSSPQSISGPHSSKFPLQPSPLVVTGCQVPGTASVTSSVSLPVPDPSGIAVITPSSPSSIMDVVPPSSSVPPPVVTSLPAAPDQAEPSVLGESSVPVRTILRPKRSLRRFQDSSVQTVDKTVASVATGTDRQPPIVSVRVWEMDRSPKRHVQACMQDLLTLLIAAYGEEPKNGFCTVFWQIVDNPKEPMELPAPIYDLGYPSLQGHSFQVVSNYRP
jgi:hypothetical protein